MYTANLNTIELNEFHAKEITNQCCRATFPLLGAMGSTSSAMVLIELQPGDRLGCHTDSAEETLLVLDGTVVAVVGNERGRLSRGEIALVPEMVPHDIVNIGDEVARIVGFFGGAANIVATFEQTWLPTESNVVDTAAMAAA